MGVNFDGPVFALADASKFKQRIMEDAVTPVMSYFMPLKSTSAGRSFINQQRKRWEELTTQADTIAIVGVKVRPRDEHIWRPIASSNAKVVYCTGPTAGESFQEWSKNERPGKKDLVLKGYFAEEFDNICREMSLPVI